MSHLIKTAVYCSLFILIGICKLVTLTDSIKTIEKFKIYPFSEISVLNNLFLFSFLRTLLKFVSYSFISFLDFLNFFLTILI